MSIAVSVLTTSGVARNNGGAARQENRPQLSKVSRVALENAASVAGLLLTTEATIVEKPSKEPAMAGGMDIFKNSI